MNLELDTVRMGETGLEVSEIAFGTWRFGRETAAGNLETDRETAHDLLSAYEAAGGRFIDTANVYGGGDSERWIGEWLEERTREEYVVASKVYWPTREDDPNASGLNRGHLRRQLDLMLERLGTDYLDILYIHRWDDDTPSREFMTTLDEFVTSGRVHYLGASSFRPDTWKLAQANERARHHDREPFSLTQPRYNLVDREIEGEYLDFCREEGLAVFPWSPLAQGFLTGKYTREEGLTGESTASDSNRWEEQYLTGENFETLDVVRAVAEETGATPAQVALAYHRHHPDVTAPLVGARTVEQLEENLRAATVELSGDQFERLEGSKAGPFERFL
jgi:aryl-alcohol dehydrogenase-like predicted oxidoreductase